MNRFQIAGSLIPKYREIFHKNPLFVGMRLPEVKQTEPLEKRYPRISADALSFIQVLCNLIINTIGFSLYDLLTVFVVCYNLLNLHVFPYLITCLLTYLLTYSPTYLRSYSVIY